MTLTKQAEEFQRRVQGLSNENSELRRKISEKETEIRSRMKQVEEMKKIDWEFKYKAEISALEAQCLKFRQRAEELEANNKILVSENELLSRSTREKQRELENLKRKMVGFEASVDKREVLAIEELCASYESRMLEIRTKLEAEIDHYKAEVNRISEDLSFKERELMNVYDLLEKRKREEERRSHEMMSGSIHHSPESGDKQKRGLYERIEELEQRLEESEREKEHLRTVFQRNSLELNARNKELVEKLRELDGLKVKFDESLNDLGKSQMIATSGVFRKSVVSTQRPKEKHFEGSIL